MIPVTLQPEPTDFDEKVRKKGHAWLQKNGIALSSSPPKASDLPNYWSCFNESLWEAYSGVCAYLAIRFEFSTGAASTDHFIAKSRLARDAYEWSNYRLACIGANRKKHAFDDVLDPVGLAPHTFTLNLLSGEMKPNSTLSPAQKKAAENTISRLDLNSKRNCTMRANRFKEYKKNNCSLDFLKRESPFIYEEITRQGQV